MLSKIKLFLDKLFENVEPTDPEMEVFFKKNKILIAVFIIIVMLSFTVILL